MSALIKKTQTKPERVALILLAGVGRRMSADKPKSLLPLPELPSTAVDKHFLGRNIRILSDAGIEHFILVLSEQNASLFAREYADNPDITLVINHDDVTQTGSSLSVAWGLQTVMTAPFFSEIRDCLILDGDIIFEQQLAQYIVDFPDAGVFYTREISADDEEVCIYEENGRPVLIGKGIKPSFTQSLSLAGESLGIIKIDRNLLTVVQSVTHWLVGNSPDQSAIAMKPYGYSKQRSEHEEIWQYLFNLRALASHAVPDGLLFSECDSPQDYQYICESLYPAIVARDQSMAKQCITGVEIE